MNTLIGEYQISSDLCYALQRLITLNSNKKTTAMERGYTMVSSYHMSRVWMSLYELEIYRCISTYKQDFEYAFKGCSGIEMEHPYNLQHYAPGKHYSVWHCENNGIRPYNTRHLAFMTYLNTVENGGETEFLYQNKKVSPVCGKTLVWPAYFTHTHRGIPAETDKYIVTGWFRYFDTDKFSRETEHLSDSEFYSSLDQLDTVL